MQVQNFNKSDLVIHLSRRFPSLSDEIIIDGIDFILQELFRETSTLSVKLDDPAHKSRALDMKLLVEEMREQAQNVE